MHAEEMEGARRFHAPHEDALLLHVLAEECRIELLRHDGCDLGVREQSREAKRLRQPVRGAVPAGIARRQIGSAVEQGGDALAVGVNAGAPMILDPDLSLRHLLQHPEGGPEHLLHDRGHFRRVPRHLHDDGIAGVA
jgi:hypothetical protein